MCLFHFHHEDNTKYNTKYDNEQWHDAKTDNLKSRVQTPILNMLNEPTIQEQKNQNS